MQLYDPEALKIASKTSDKGFAFLHDLNKGIAVTSAKTNNVNIMVGP